MITYDGQIAAFAGRRTARLVAPFDELEPADPRRRMVELMCAFAVACTGALLPGPYSDEAAARFARLVLIDDGEFVAYGDGDDDRLAQRFGVPIGEIAHKRHDLTRWRAERSGPGGLPHVVRAIRLRPAACIRRTRQARASRHRDRRRRACPRC